jgi:hypothetical protein
MKLCQHSPASCLCACVCVHVSVYVLCVLCLCVFEISRIAAKSVNIFNSFKYYHTYICHHIQTCDSSVTCVLVSARFFPYSWKLCFWLMIREMWGYDATDRRMSSFNFTLNNVVLL